VPHTSFTPRSRFESRRNSDFASRNAPHKNQKRKVVLRLSRGVHDPSLLTVQEIAKALNVETKELV
jgi:hypothetical protein